VVFDFIIPSLRFLFSAGFESKLPRGAFDCQGNFLFFYYYPAVIRVKIYKPITIVSKSTFVFRLILKGENLVGLDTDYVIVF
jgi:hypothetical protein